MSDESWREQHPAIYPCAITGQGMTNETLKRRLRAEQDATQRAEQRIAELETAIQRARAHIAYERDGEAENTLSAVLHEGSCPRCGHELSE